MKKLFLFTSIFAATFAFAQVKVTPESKALNDVYKGGNEQLTKDVQANVSAFGSEYNVNGQFVITFDLDKDGKIINPKVFPEQVDNGFNFDLIRAFKRVKDNFTSETPKKDLAILLDFRTNFTEKSSEKSRFSTPPPATR